jgi:hypothetical protein
LSGDENSKNQVEELLEDNLEREKQRKELLAEIEHIKLWVNTSIENGLFETYGKKSIAEPIKSLFRKFLSFIKKDEKKDEQKNVIDEKKDEQKNVIDEKKDEQKNVIDEKKDEEPYQQILKHLKEARKHLADSKLPENERLGDAEYSLSLAREAYSKALYSAPLSWRFFNEYAGHIWIWLVGLLTVVFFIFYYQDIFDLQNKLKVGDAAISAVAWGVIGAVLRAMWFLKEKVDERIYRKSWNVFFISVPFLGGMLGAIVYLILFAGLSVLANDINNTDNISPVENTTTITNTTTIANSTGTTSNMTTTPVATDTTERTLITPLDTTTQEVDRIDPLTIIPFAALAGFNWEWAVRFFRGIEGRIR